MVVLGVYSWHCTQCTGSLTVLSLWPQFRSFLTCTSPKAKSSRGLGSKSQGSGGFSSRSKSPLSSSISTTRIVGEQLWISNKNDFDGFFLEGVVPRDQTQYLIHAKHVLHCKATSLGPPKYC